jgi:DNA helicase II / ATP-dependent DNA helicase PcrA
MSGGPSLWRAALEGGDPFAHLSRGSDRSIGRGPGWDRAAQSQASSGSGVGRDFGPRGTAAPREARVSAVSLAPSPTIRRGARVFHAKFGEGTVFHVDGNKLEIDFPAAGRKRVLDSFVSLKEA